MMTQGSERTKRQIVGRPIEWIKRFDVNDYRDNPPMIEKLFEERQLALSSTLELEKRVKELGSQNHQLELANQRLELIISEVSRKSLVLFSLSLLATILVGIGVNVATSSPNNFTGWVMIVAASIIELIAFLLRPRDGK
jgi:hypothetical protein